MAPNLSKLTTKQMVAGSAVGFTTVLALAKLLQHYQQKQRLLLKEYGDGGENKNKDRKKEQALYANFQRILKIIFPSFISGEVLFLLLIAASLLSRTYCDIFMISNTTKIESAIIRRDMKDFIKHIKSFVFFAPFMAFANSSLKFTLSELTLRIRTRLSDHLYKEYMNGNTFYQISNLDGRISNADQILTQDVEKFCHSITDFYSNFSKPILEIVFYLRGLSSHLGIQAPITMLGSMIFAGYVASTIRRPVAKFTATEQHLEGEYRHVNSRLIASSEEVAFYRGNEKEKTVIRQALSKLVGHVRKFIYFRFFMSIIDNILVKYFGRLIGTWVICVPYLITRRMDSVSDKQRIEFYYTSGRMLLKLAECVGRVLLASREFTKLSGYTVRVSKLMEVLNDLNKGHYERKMVTDQNGHSNQNDKSAGYTEGSQKKLAPGSGKIKVQDNIIRFDRVPLITPNGDVLVKELNFTVESGMNVLVCGPNGCGKSSLFRILGELWPLFGGELTKPGQGNLFYVPQKPYMTIGSLRDQVIYPDSEDDMKRKGIGDETLVQYLEIVQLNYILDRERGWDAIQDWIDVLSGGEKQRIAMARLFYHKPQFAILDECTSAVSVDVEGSMYQYCREVGITLFTVSHRKSLWKHHEFYLHMDGRGSFEFKSIDSDTEEFGS